MSLQKNFLLFSVVILLTLKVIYGAGNTDSRPTFETESSDNTVDEADDESNWDDTETPPATNFIPQSSGQGLEDINYDNEHSQSALNHLADEYLRVIENEYTSLAIHEAMSKIKSTLRSKSAEKAIAKIRREIIWFLVNERSPKNVENYLTDRLHHYINPQTPRFIKQKYDKIRSYLNDPNSRRHLELVNEALISFIQMPNLEEKIVSGVTTFNQLIRLNLPAPLLVMLGIPSS